MSGALMRDPEEELRREKEGLIKRWGRSRKKMLQKVKRLVRAERLQELAARGGGDQPQDEAGVGRYASDLLGETASQASAELFATRVCPDKYHFHSEPMTKGLGRARLPRRGTRTFQEREKPGVPKSEEAERSLGAKLRQRSAGSTDYSFNFLWPPEFAYSHKEPPKFINCFPEAQRVDMKILTPNIGSTIHMRASG